MCLKKFIVFFKKRKKEIKRKVYSATCSRAAIRLRSRVEPRQVERSRAEPTPAAIEMVVPLRWFPRRCWSFIHCSALSSGCEALWVCTASCCTSDAWDSRFFILACKWWRRACDRRPLISFSKMVVSLCAAADSSAVAVGRVRGLRP